MCLKKEFQCKEIVGAEVGVFEGENAKNILEELNIKKIYLIDNYFFCKEYSKDRLNKAKQKAENRLKKFKQISWIYKDSEEGIKEIKEKLDFIYIDADHSYNKSKKDIELAMSKLNPRGLLCGHDFMNQEVARAVLELKDSFKLNLKTHHDGDWVLLKNDK